MKKTKPTLFSLLIIFLLFTANAIAQTRVEPTFWWVGMKNPNVQLLWYGNNIATAQITLMPYPGVKINKINKVKNANYLFIDVDIAKTAKAGTLRFKVKMPNQASTEYTYTLKQKTHKPLPITPADFIYLVMPDRFANGDESNDKFADMMDTNCDTGNPYYRHGGDLQGILNHLDYFQEIGATSLWLNPVLENDEPLMQEGPDRMQAGYHGYHFTDHYKVDRRFGGNEGYQKLAKAMHQRGLKLIQDAIYNHVSEAHWMYKDQPMDDWFNRWDTYTATSHKEQVITDPYSSKSDMRVFTDGWFVKFLPDINQRNPYFAKYLIQNAIWCTENFTLDGWRIDTYKYNDLEFMNRCNQALLDEYPNMLIFGETTSGTVPQQAYYVRNKLNLPFKCNQPSTCDFQTSGAISTALNEKYGWSEGVNRLYNVLSQDFLYEDPSKLVTFLENHDTDRFYSVIGENFDKYKMGVTWLLTSRGIPHWYYGTEFLMKNFKNPTDAEVRRDFPGGFKNDKENKFTAGGRTTQENEAFNFVKKLANYRKLTPALHSGKLMHYQPKDGIYTYFRYNNDKTIMVIMNQNDKDIAINANDYAERTNGFRQAKNIMADEMITNLSAINVPKQSAVVIELIKN